MHRLVTGIILMTKTHLIFMSLSIEVKIHSKVHRRLSYKRHCFPPVFWGTNLSFFCFILASSDVQSELCLVPMIKP